MVALKSCKQQINQIRRFSSIPQTPDSVITQGAVLFVQAAGVEGGFTSSSVSLAFESDVTSGNVIAVFAPWGNQTTTLDSISADCVSAGFTFVGNPSDGDTGRVAMAYGIIDITGSCTVTGTWSDQAAFPSILVHEISGIDTTDVVDQSSFNNQANPGTFRNGATTGVVTTTRDGEYIFAGIMNDTVNRANFRAGTGYLQQLSVGTSVLKETEDQIQTTAGRIAATWTSRTAWHNALTGMMTLNPAAADGGGDGTVIQDVVRRQNN